MAEKKIPTNTKGKVAHTEIPNQHIAASGDQSADIQTLARLAGLDRAWAHFPQDVTTAAKTALNIRASFQPLTDNTAEVWPVMQVKS